MKINPQLNYLFVYGTLRKEFGLQLSSEIKGDIIYICGAVINGEMYDIGEYPAALPSTNDNAKITGEIYELKHLRKIFRLLDEYEGYDRKNLNQPEYYRKKETLELDSGEKVQAWVYWYNFPIKNKKRIRKKDYLQYLKNKTA